MSEFKVYEQISPGNCKTLETVEADNFEEANEIVLEEYPDADVYLLKNRMTEEWQKSEDLKEAE